MSETAAKETKPRRTRKVDESPAAPEPAERMTPTQRVRPDAPPGVRRPMEQGDRGDRVRELQEELTRRGLYAGKVSGVYGYETVRAVRRLQGSLGVRPSGVVDADIWSALFGGAK